MLVPRLPEPLSSPGPLVEEDSELLDALPRLEARWGRLGLGAPDRALSIGTGTGTKGVAIRLDVFPLSILCSPCLQLCGHLPRLRMRPGWTVCHHAWTYHHNVLWKTKTKGQVTYWYQAAAD